ncbi:MULTISPECIES: LysR family transcriptional regulator [unclassified Halomonas]|jgi:LysR family transcriptional regulator for metE and metH|uniref:LysR family transcriptional regulator n=1 Tax=unclassified Halomonas TaxID=2609666 RepID=UPI000288A1E1|nr:MULTISPECIES: LysR family transcriptional regulator [unclassified Halomonas]MCE8037451.1 LysR family transcriptional regulator [Halomonas sp. MCCC 1A11062]
MTTRLSTRQMQMMVAIADAGSISDAAVQLGLTQSALSHRLKEAERLLGALLFTRGQRRLNPTSAGKRLLHAARGVLAELERAEQDIQRLAVGVEQVVRVGVEACGGYHWLPTALAAFNRSHPHIGVEIVPDVSLEPCRALRRGHVDLALVAGSHPPIGFDTTVLKHDELRLAVRHDHSLARQAWVGAEDVAAEPYVAYHTTPEKGREYEQLFSPAGVLPARVISAGVTEAVLSLVRHGLGVSVLPAWTLEPHLTTGDLASLRLTEQGLYLNWYLVMRQGEAEGSAAEALAHTLQAVITGRRECE